MIENMPVTTDKHLRYTTFTFSCLVILLFLSGCISPPNNLPVSIVTDQPQRLGADCQQALDHSHELIQNHKVLEAEKDLKTLARLECKSGYETDQYLRLLAYALSHQKKYPEAIKTYQKIIKSKYLDLVTRSEAVYTLAQVYYLQGDYQSVITQVADANSRQLLIDDDLQVLVARSYYHRADAANAMAIMGPIIQQAVIQDQVIKEPWLVFSWGLYLDSQFFEHALVVGDQLMAHYPNDQYRNRIKIMCQREDLLHLCGMTVK